ncbi:Cof-type HAD-IIB family hydrolase [[Mycoplasma] testudinis]|uniref:Cof-type HAD-IIB family hydrolase n=1 Tax=[Mycoplasma] testudinis TaxID=33924 RepID=UPI000487AFA3|nr:HAD family hydrolase [[Mycoplasma] testudinis]
MNSNKIKYIYSDLDETIVPKVSKETCRYGKYTFNDLLEISERNQKAIKTCQDLALGFGIATGRSYQKTYPIIQKLKIDIPVVCLDGAQIYLKNKLLLSECLHPGLIYSFNKIINRNQDVPFFLISDYTTYLSETDDWMTAEEEMYLEKELFPENDFLYSVRLNPETTWDLPFEKVNTILIMIEKMTWQMQKEIELLCNQFDAHFIRYNRVIQILPLNVSKVSALKYISQYLLKGMSPFNTAVFGDNKNDIEMLKWSHWGVAMENGHLTAKECAKYICRDVNEDGVALWIEKNILNKTTKGENN